MHQAMQGNDSMGKIRLHCEAPRTVHTRSWIIVLISQDKIDQAVVCRRLCADLQVMAQIRIQHINLSRVLARPRSSQNIARWLRCLQVPPDFYLRRLPIEISDATRDTLLKSTQHALYTHHLQQR